MEAECGTGPGLNRGSELSSAKAPNLVHPSSARKSAPSGKSDHVSAAGGGRPTFGSAAKRRRSGRFRNRKQKLEERTTAVFDQLSRVVHLSHRCASKATGPAPSRVSTKPRSSCSASARASCAKALSVRSAALIETCRQGFLHLDPERIASVWDTQHEPLIHVAQEMKEPTYGWPAIQRYMAALSEHLEKVLSKKVKDARIDILGDAALAFFTSHSSVKLRARPGQHEPTFRVSMIFHRDRGWLARDPFSRILALRSGRTGDSGGMTPERSSHRWLRVAPPGYDGSRAEYRTRSGPPIPVNLGSGSGHRHGQSVEPGS